MCNKEKLMNPNAFQLGVPGSGKSFLTKEQIVFLALATQDDIIICDPEAEYSLLVKELGGEVITIAAGSENHINAMDMLKKVMVIVAIQLEISHNLLCLYLNSWIEMELNL